MGAHGVNSQNKIFLSKNYSRHWFFGIWAYPERPIACSRAIQDALQAVFLNRLPSVLMWGSVLRNLWRMVPLSRLRGLFQARLAS